MHPSPIYHLQDMKQAGRQSTGNMTPGRNLKAQKCLQFELHAEQTMGFLPHELQPRPKGSSLRFMSSDSTYPKLTMNPVCLLLIIFFLHRMCVEWLKGGAFFFLYISLHSLERYF